MYFLALCRRRYYGILTLYTFDSRIRFSETDANKQLRLTSIINYFQDCSSFQSEQIGAGFSLLEKRHRAWIISSWQLEVTRFPLFNERITIGTWPTEFKGMFGNRDYVLLAETGETLAAAHSIWVYLDTATLRPTRILPEDSAPYMDYLQPPHPMQMEGRKILIPDVFTEKEPIPVTTAHLDTNRHVNNGQYISMAESCLPNDFIPHKMRVDYRKAAVLGDIIYPRISVHDDCCTIVLGDSLGTPYAVIEFK